jgi:TM2 domain-containing membrane protein YozV
MGQDTKNHPGVAAVLSFIFNGLGQLYNGQILKGLVIIFLSSLSLLIFILGAALIGFWLIGKLIFPGQIIFGGILFTSGLISILSIGVYSILDAYRTALKK